MELFRSHGWLGYVWARSFIGSSSTRGSCAYVEHLVQFLMFDLFVKKRLLEDLFRV